MHQKDDSLSTPVCYSFDWTKEKINHYVGNELTPNPLEDIRKNKKENVVAVSQIILKVVVLENVTKYIKGLA